MLIFIDESGDAGFKFAKGSSQHFILSMLIFPTEQDERYLNAEKLSIDVFDLKRKLKLKHELKFHKLRRDYSLQFFEVLAKHQFKIRFIIIDKSLLYSPNLRQNKENFYNYFLRQMLSHSKASINNATIKIDGSGNKLFQKKLKTYLRKNLPNGSIKKIKMVDSKKDILIQVADLLAGGYMFYLKHNDDKFIKKIKKKIENVWNFE